MQPKLEVVVEYKPMSNFYRRPWFRTGDFALIVGQLGDRESLVELGQHLPNTKSEQIVATLCNPENIAERGFISTNYKYEERMT